MTPGQRAYEAFYPLPVREPWEKVSKYKQAVWANVAAKARRREPVAKKPRSVVFWVSTSRPRNKVSVESGEDYGVAPNGWRRRIKQDGVWVRPSSVFPTRVAALRDYIKKQAHWAKGSIKRAAQHKMLESQAKKMLRAK